ncbi:hypothetical protein [Castellaniella ginsengisoli]|uniref:Uncharacterized protein n=1 Tax=Castellaniella ginsengisoli TaxID=546114 RepID=A0AB39CTY2_9BURK
MAITFCDDFKDTVSIGELRERVLAQMNGQSLAVAAALALAAGDRGENALNMARIVFDQLAEQNRWFGVPERDQKLALEHFNEIFSQARQIIGAQNKA